MKNTDFTKCLVLLSVTFDPFQHDSPMYNYPHGQQNIMDEKCIHCCENFKRIKRNFNRRSLKSLVKANDVSVRVAVLELSKCLDYKDQGFIIIIIIINVMVIIIIIII